MIRFIFLFLFQLIVIKASISQVWNHYNWNDSVKLDNQVFENNGNSFYKRYNGHLYVGDISEKDKKALSMLLYDEYRFGKIYPNFYGFEKYIKDVLCQLVKDTSQTNRINIYLCYNSDFNLSMDAFGNLRVFVGAFNYLNNEAELASILGHEYGHYFNKDVISSSVSDSKMKESSADFLSVKLLKNSQYPLNAMANVFKTFKREEIKVDLREGNNTYSKRNISHPDPGDRLKQVKILSKDSLNINRRNYIVDSVKFQQLKKIASQESYNIMMRYGDFHNVIELSFRDYLYYPDDMENLAILNEALRRYILLNAETANKQFIINYYKGKGAKKSNNYEWVDNDKTSILRYLNKGLLFLKSGDLSKIAARELLDSVNVKFATYKEALDYFSKISSEKQCKPCMVSDILKSETTLAYNEEVVKNNTVIDCNPLLNSFKSKPNYREAIVIINSSRLDSFDYYDVDQRKMYFEFLEKCQDKIKKQLGIERVYLQAKLPIEDIKLFSVVNSLGNSIVEPELYENAIRINIACHNDSRLINLLKSQHVNVKKIKNWYLTNPEAYEVFDKYKAKNIYFIDFDFIEFMRSDLRVYGFSVTESKAVSYSWQFKMVGLDYKEQNMFYKHDMTISKKNQHEAFSECLEQFKWFFVR
ncbi:MAG TPA: M48 family metallopeptidase [Bacteroidia bacterium]|nr:M48 family metallopeptidase [Bacteroidia bacterium]